MVAESYQLEGDLSVVSNQLAWLGVDPPKEMVSEAILFAQKAGYTDADTQLLLSLQKDLKDFDAILEASPP